MSRPKLPFTSNSKKDWNASVPSSDTPSSNNGAKAGSDEVRVKTMTEQNEFSAGQEQHDEIMIEGENRAISLVESLRELNEEFNQIKQSLEIEKTISRELSSFMKDFLPQVGKSYDLDPALFPKLAYEVKKVTLTPQCIFFLTYQDGLTVARTIDNVSPESMMKVLEEILPSMKVHFKERRERIALRSIGLYRVAAEIREMSLSSKTTSMDKASPSNVQNNSARPNEK